ncbi:four-carbon acid sugar kinase family protein [Curtobacterium sp. MCBD17_035]|uniref:four-carbon acid sugar kinase family protein n=1 Tax=Curtobacterium sp. MCBD17_035 TaxID=2175673 RepID=UPI001C6537B0|nr:four-carbon acid sugar kinase family protein [Curtobacterium sp. MCBD17_035]WIB66943.1 four-carbon acid sugar kinase family protein [Curtobacterium sp. MCBD17_035]
MSLLDLPHPLGPVDVDTLRAAVTDSRRRIVVIDDDPTGSQSIADLPLVTAWADDDIRWAFDQDTVGFFVLANTRSLEPDAAERVVREVHDRVSRIAAERGEDVVLLSRGDSTLRGHFPLETDVLVAAEDATGRTVDAVLLVPAYPDAGRITVDSVHYLAQGDAWIPVGDSEFARDASFGYRSSSLPDWVAEKTDGRVPAGEVVRITIDDIRNGGAATVAAALRSCRDARVVVADAVDEDDLRVVALGALRAETDGTRIVYRVGPSFVRARCGQDVHGPIADATLAESFTHAPEGHGLIAVGSHVGLTGRQLDGLLAADHPAVVELDLARCLESTEAMRDVVAAAAARAASLLDTTEVVVMTSRTLIRGVDADDSLRISRVASESLVATVRAVVERRRPSFLVAKGGITSNDLATEALHIGHAHVIGTLLAGMVSLWVAADGPSAGLPYVVFPGNVGSDQSLAVAVRRVADAAALDGLM